ncbi:MAG: metalloprotease PmbA [Gammaproteobacteria bacterium]|nr:metalloprotease PmbA [Gammaproteobacteria bacterium]
MSDKSITEQSTRFDPATERARLEALGALALDEAARLGASSAELAASLEEGLSVKARLGEVDTVEHNRDKSMGITVYFGHRQASASSSDFTEDAVRETVAAACGIAKHTSEDPCAGLADADLMATDIPDLDLYHPWALDADEAIELAVEMETAARQHDLRISNTGGANVSRHQSVSLYCNSHGFVGVTAGTRHALSCSVIAGEGLGMQRDHAWSMSRLPFLLDAPVDVGREAATRAIARLGAKPVRTGRFPVLFSAEMARGLLGSFIASISGSALYRRSTFMLDKLGEQVFAGHIRISEDPLLPQALGSAAFDSDGLARKPRDLVDQGVLQGYVLSNYNACKLNMAPTGNAGGVRNLILHPGRFSEQELLAELGTGLYVTEMMGQGVKLTNGDYSRGAGGFWVENGKIQHAVQEVTVAGNLADMFLNITAVGETMDMRGNIRTPAFLVREMTVAGE